MCGGNIGWDDSMAKADRMMEPGPWVPSGICSPVSPGWGYVNYGPCRDPATGVGSEACLCWLSSLMFTAQPFPFDENPEAFDANP